MIIKLFQRLHKIQHKLALLLPSKYTKTLIDKHFGIQMKQLRFLKKSLQSRTERQNLRKVWRGPQYFVRMGSIANENPSEQRGF